MIVMLPTGLPMKLLICDDGKQLSTTGSVNSYFLHDSENLLMQANQQVKVFMYSSKFG